MEKQQSTYTCRHFNMESKCGEICHFPWWFKSCKAMIKSLLLFFACNVFWQGNSWHTFSPDARICSPTGTQVSRVFKGLRIKRNNSKKTETTPPPPKRKTPNNPVPPNSTGCLSRKHSEKHKSPSAPLFLSCWAGEVENLSFSMRVGCEWILITEWALLCCGEFLLLWPVLLFAGCSHGLEFLLGFGFPSLLFNLFLLLIQNLPVDFRACRIYIK